MNLHSRARGVHQKRTLEGGGRFAPTERNTIRQGHSIMCAASRTRRDTTRRRNWCQERFNSLECAGQVALWPNRELSRPLLLECPCDIAAPGRRGPKRRQVVALQGVELALEDFGRSRLSAEIQYAGVAPLRARLQAQEATRHDH
jgi:hypothetical protein